MNVLALIATMITLATPTAHGSFKLTCAPMVTAGLAFPWENRIQLSPEICKLNFRTILHRNITPLQAEIGTMDLLHEAAHVGQWREGERFTDPARPWEHDAECRALLGLPIALHQLQYKVRFVRAATRLARDHITVEQSPYGGHCG